MFTFENTCNNQTIIKSQNTSFDQNEKVDQMNQQNDESLQKDSK